MLRPVGQIARFYAYFSYAGEGKTGMADVTINIDRDVSTAVKTGEAMTEVSSARHPGWYYYALPAADADTAGDYIATATTAAGVVDNKDVPCLVTLTGSVPITESPNVTFDVDLQYLRRMLRIRLNDLTADGDPGGNYDTEALDFFINLAYRETVRKCKSYYTTITVPTVDDQEEYDGTTLFEITHIVGTTADSQPLKRTTMRELLMIDQDYRAAAKSTPTHWYPTKGGYFGMYPKPTGIVSYYVSGYAYPTALTSDAHTPVALPDGDAIQVLLDRAECHARRARPTHANNVQLAAQLEQSWLGWCQEIRDSIRSEGN